MVEAERERLDHNRMIVKWNILEGYESEDVDWNTTGNGDTDGDEHEMEIKYEQPRVSNPSGPTNTSNFTDRIP